MAESQSVRVLRGVGLEKFEVISSPNDRQAFAGIKDHSLASICKINGEEYQKVRTADSNISFCKKA